MPSPRDDVTPLLRRWGHGDRGALDELMPLIYKELQKLAKRHMTQQEPGHTLQTTALIHEAYLKLGGAPIRIGRIELTSSASRPRRCGTCWWITRARGGLPSAAGRSGSRNSMRASMPESRELVK